ncbi:MAG: ATP-binding protein, partial [Akkermansia sp.]|nr:ATP-binding protein [Akkermansia sp.]
MSKGSKKSVSDIVKSWYRDRNKWTEATWALEFKSGKNGFPKTLWETYSAFANTSGGIIIVGVDNTGALEDIKTAEKYREDFSNILSSGTKCNNILCNEEDIAIVELSGREVLAIRVKAATVAQKPVCLDGNPTKC